VCCAQWLLLRGATKGDKLLTHALRDWHSPPSGDGKVAQYIDYVVGMSQKIGDKAAIQFPMGFYDALGTGGWIEFAYKLGRSAIEMHACDVY